MESTEKAQNFPYISASSDTGVWKSEIYVLFLKRVFDLCLCLILLPFVLPILFILLVFIKFDSKGPALYRSERIGKNGKRFNCLKLRTMCEDAHNLLPVILHENPDLEKEYSKFKKLKRDPRITNMGKFLRSTSLDELPQVFNVLIGEMSFIGPRPAFEDEINQYGGNSNLYKSVKPGITGLWQVNGRSDTTFSARVKMDTIYVKNLTFLNDIKILLKTIPAALSKKGAY